MKFCLYEAARTTRIIHWKQMFPNSKQINWGNLYLKILKNFSWRVQFYKSCRLITRYSWRILLSFGEHLFQGIIFSGCFQKLKRNTEGNVKESRLTKRITKDCLFLYSKINVKKFHITSQVIHSNALVLSVSSLLHLWYISRISIAL